jgi:hypothetical protein
MKRILFILKEKQYSLSLTSYGLINSANHIAHYLESKHYQCKIVQVVDANGIDKEVHDYNPDIVIIEALWVTAPKLSEIMSLWWYKHIKWVVRIHSDIGFLSTEGWGVKLINDYIELKRDNLIIAFNNHGFVKALSNVMEYDFTYLPNVMTVLEPEDNDSEEKSYMKIGCFGALRLLKNQCFQAVCAIMAANKLNKKLFFHITPNLAIQDDSVLKNLRELFKNIGHELMVHNWMPNHTFQSLIGKMDLGLQLSYTESFNIVTADFINNNKLIIVSDAIVWMPPSMRVSTTDYEEVVDKIVHIYKHRNSNLIKSLVRRHLREYNEGAEKVWDDFLKQHHGSKK